MKLQFIFTVLTALFLFSCNDKTVNQPPKFNSFDDYPTAEKENLWLDYSKDKSIFKIWSPVAQEVKIKFYKSGNGGTAFDSTAMRYVENGLWIAEINKDLNKTYYTYQIKQNGKWLNETPGIYAKAVGVNGKRAMVLDMQSTNPEGWDADKTPQIASPNQAIIYELHVRDMTSSDNSGSNFKGKFLGLVESGTQNPDGLNTGIEHLKELGISYVHLLPSFDNYSVDETNLDKPQYNWGYDPQNYNVPEGSYSSDPFHAEVRIKEFKQMVKTFHDNGIGVILDVVYNHTGRTDDCPLNLEVPGYYYRHNPDGTFSNASGCGNETASERTMMRKFMIESVTYWASEYHIDAFRFDLMGIHDIETMQLISDAVKSVNPQAFVYGEGWTAGDSPLPEAKRALKKHMYQTKNVIAFSDDIRDGLKGSVFDDKSTGFVSGASGTEESIKFGVVGSVFHPQIDYKAVNYSDTAWTNEPWQAVSYVSCHDNHTLFDKLKISVEDADIETIKAMDKLANAVVLTSQAVPFIHAGAEMLRTKGGEHNSYNLPDSVNQIDWSRKTQYRDVFNYYKNLIHLRKNHPAFWMPSADMLRKHLKFKDTKTGLVGYSISDNANGDKWNEIIVYYNANKEPQLIDLEGEWTVVAFGNDINEKGIKTVKGKIKIPGIAMFTAYR